MEKIKEFVDKYPWLLMVAPIVVVAVVGFFFLSQRTQPSALPGSTGAPVSNSGSSTTQSSQATNASSTQNSGFNIFSFILRLFGGNNTTNTTATTTSSSPSTTSQSSNQEATTPLLLQILPPIPQLQVQGTLK